jgi:DinB superfamily
MSIDWNEELAGQLDGHWRSQLRPRLDGLTDEEYFWEPVPGMWSVRRRGEGRDPRAEGFGRQEASGEGIAPVALGGGEFTLDFAWPAPDPVPATTIAWRLSHLIVAVFGLRVGSHFGGEPVDYEKYDYPGDAATALAQLDEFYAAWIAGVRGLGADGLARPCGPAEGPYAEASMATLVLHINREAIHHGAEVALLRDLFRWQPGEA